MGVEILFAIESGRHMSTSSVGSLRLVHLQPILIRAAPNWLAG
jgi:hypothetical protein